MLDTAQAVRRAPVRKAPGPARGRRRPRHGPYLLILPAIAILGGLLGWPGPPIGRMAVQKVRGGAPRAGPEGSRSGARPPPLPVRPVPADSPGDRDHRGAARVAGHADRPDVVPEGRRAPAPRRAGGGRRARQLPADPRRRLLLDDV